MDAKDAIIIGHPEIDRQHQQILSHLRTIVREIADAPPATVTVIAPGLARQLVAHFARHYVSEESLMASIDYPEREGHVEEHKIFYARMKDALERVDRERSIASVLVLVACGLDWIPHVLTADLRFAEHYREHARGRN